MREVWVRSLGQEDLLEKGLATHSSVLAWRIPWTEEPGGYSPRARKESDLTETHSLYQTNNLTQNIIKPTVKRVARGQVFWFFLKYKLQWLSPFWPRVWAATVFLQWSHLSLSQTLLLFLGLLQRWVSKKRLTNPKQRSASVQARPSHREGIQAIRAAAWV